MKSKPILLFLSLMLLVASNLYAQQRFSITGKVAYPAQKSTAAASVFLRKSSDSSLVKTALVDAEGKFTFANIPGGNYSITITLLGFKAERIDFIKLDRDLDLPQIELKEQNTKLANVEITAEKKLVEQKIDRTVVNVDAMLSAPSETAMDILEKSPGIIVDQNGSISLKGKSSVTIFIDGKPTYLSGSDLAGYLRSLSGSTLEQIELMSNPPAKYDAAGNGGVINIKTKKIKQKGFNGGLNLSFIQGKLTKTNNSANFNYRRQKINVFGNLSLVANNAFSDLNINRYFSNPGVSPTFLQNSYIRRMGESYNARLGIDYYLSSETTIGIGFSGLLNPSRERTTNTSLLKNQMGNLDSSIVALNNQERSFENGGLNFNYRKQFSKSGAELNADVDYVGYATDADQAFDNRSYNSAGVQKMSDLLTGKLPASIEIVAVKADFSKPLAKGYKFETGLKSSYTKTDNVANYFITQNNQTVADYDKTNHFKYSEQINAAYVNLAKDFKRISFQLGLRLENTLADGRQLGNLVKPDSSFSRDYTGIFPTAYVQFRLDSTGNQSLNIDYGRRIDRPFYQDLNPFLAPLDKFTYYVGNPFLKPSYSHSVEMTYMYKRWSLNLNYSRSLDNVGETIEINQGIYYSRPGNLGKEINMGIGVDGNVDLSKKLNFNFTARATNIHTISDFYTGKLDTRGTFYFGRAMFQLKLPKDWSAQLDGSYQTKITSAQFTLGDRGRLNAAIAKKLSAATTIRLVGNDLLYTWVNSGVINNLANTKANWRNIGDSRTLVFSLTYRFGKAMSDLRRHNANATEAEQGRVKN